jgi:hypothetical protein
MKVYEIISEGNLSSLLGRGAELVGKALGRDKKDLIKSAGEQAASWAKSSGKSIEDAATSIFQRYNSILTNAMKAPENAGKSVEQVAKELNIHPMYADPKTAKQIANAGYAVKSAGVAGKLAKGMLSPALLTAWNLYELTGPITEYNQQIKRAQQQGWDQPTYQAYVNRQATILVASEAKLLTTAIIGRVISGVAGRALGLAFPKLGSFISKLGPTVALTYFGTEERRQQLAAGLLSILGPEVMDSIGAVISPFTEQLRNWNPISSTPTSGGSSSSVGTTNPTKQDISNTSSNPPANQDYDYDPHGISQGSTTAMGRQMYTNNSKAVNNYDVTGWVTKPGKPGFIQDPNNPANFLPKPAGWTGN